MMLLCRVLRIEMSYLLGVMHRVEDRRMRYQLAKILDYHV